MIDHHILQNKVLKHHCSEGPGRDLIYRGRVQLFNVKAEINIDLASNMTQGTFKALNKNPQVFLSDNTNWDQIKMKILNKFLLDFFLLLIIFFFLQL